MAAEWQPFSKTSKSDPNEVQIGATRGPCRIGCDRDGIGWDGGGIGWVGDGIGMTTVWDGTGSGWGRDWIGLEQGGIRMRPKPIQHGLYTHEKHDPDPRAACLQIPYGSHMAL